MFLSSSIQTIRAYPNLRAFPVYQKIPFLFVLGSRLTIRVNRMEINWCTGDVKYRRPLAFSLSSVWLNHRVGPVVLGGVHESLYTFSMLQLAKCHESHISLCMQGYI